MRNGRSGTLYLVAATMIFSNTSFAGSRLQELCAKGLIGDEECVVVTGAAVTAAAGAGIAYKANSNIQQTLTEEKTQQAKLAGAIAEANESKLRLYLQPTGEAAPTDVIPESRRAPHLPGTPEFNQAYNLLGGQQDSYKLDVVLKGEMAQQEAARVALAEALSLENDLKSAQTQHVGEVEIAKKYEGRVSLLTEQLEAMDKYLSKSQNGSAVVNPEELIQSLRSEMTKLEKIQNMGDDLTPEQTKSLQEMKVLRDYVTSRPRAKTTEGALREALKAELKVTSTNLDSVKRSIESFDGESKELTESISEKRALAERYASGKQVPQGNIRTSYYKVGDRLFQVVDKEGTLVEMDGKSAAHIEKLKASGSTPTALIKFNTKNSRSLVTSVRARTGGMILGAIGLGIVLEELAVGSLRQSDSTPVTRVQPVSFEGRRAGATK